MNNLKKVVFVGNPNSGKSSIINAIAGSKLSVGNWNGVTTEKQEAFLSYKNKDYQLLDLPGVYSLENASNEEAISANFLKEKDYDIIINVVDSTNLERNFFLTKELISLNKPIIMLLNFYDEVEKLGNKIDIKKLQEQLGIVILPTVGYKSKTKTNVLDMLESSTVIEPKNFNIADVVKNTVTFGKIHRLKVTEKVDNIILHPYLGIPVFAVSMVLFFNVIIGGSAPLIDSVDVFFNETLAPFLHPYFDSYPTWLSSLLIDGVVVGVGGILTFVPLMTMLYFFLALLEESGYMGRVAFLIDRLMSSFGLNGKAFVPLILGFGCSVPAIYSTRTLDNMSSRKLTAVMAPFMSCGARLPVYALFTASFFPNNAGLIILSLYIVGILIAFGLALCFKDFKTFKSNDDTFVIELVPYRFPNLSIVIKSTFSRVMAYLKRASTIILSMMVILWALAYFPNNGDVKKSYLIKVSSGMAYVMQPTGFANRWEVVASVLPSLLAKEAVVGFLAQVLNDGEEENPEDEAKLVEKIRGLWAGDPLANIRAYSFMLFILLAIPCVVALGAIYSVFGYKFMFFIIGLLTIIPYVASTLFFNIAKLFIGG